MICYPKFSCYFLWNIFFFFNTVWSNYDMTRLCFVASAFLDKKWFRRFIKIFHDAWGECLCYPCNTLLSCYCRDKRGLLFSEQTIPINRRNVSYALSIVQLNMPKCRVQSEIFIRWAFGWCSYLIYAHMSDRRISPSTIMPTAIDCEQIIYRAASFRKSFLIFINRSTTTADKSLWFASGDDFFAGIIFQSDEICPEILSLVEKISGFIHKNISGFHVLWEKDGR